MQAASGSGGPCCCRPRCGTARFPRVASGATACSIATAISTTTRTWAPGESLRVDTGCIVAFQPSVGYDIQYVGGVKTALFGGAGLFFAALRGPGRVWLQSLPFSRLAGRIYAAAPQKGGSREEGSILGGLGRLIDGDNS